MSDFGDFSDLDNLNNQQIWNEFVADRKNKGITQQELASKVGVTQSLISQNETGKAGEKIVQRDIKLAYKICNATGFPHKKFLPHIRTKSSQTAECKTLYLAEASDSLVTVTAYGITNKDPDQRLREQDKTSMRKHKFRAQWTFKCLCIAAAVENSIKQTFGYNPKVGEYVAEELWVVKQHVERLIELGDWDFTFCALEDS